MAIVTSLLVIALVLTGVVTVALLQRVLVNQVDEDLGSLVRNESVLKGVLATAFDSALGTSTMPSDVPSDYVVQVNAADGRGPLRLQPPNQDSSTLPPVTPGRGHSAARRSVHHRRWLGRDAASGRGPDAPERQQSPGGGHRGPLAGARRSRWSRRWPPGSSWWASWSPGPGRCWAPRRCGARSAPCGRWRPWPAPTATATRRRAWAVPRPPPRWAAWAWRSTPCWTASRPRWPSGRPPRSGCAASWPTPATSCAPPWPRCAASPSCTGWGRCAPTRT